MRIYITHIHLFDADSFGSICTISTLSGLQRLRIVLLVSLNRVHMDHTMNVIIIDVFVCYLVFADVF